MKPYWRSLLWGLFVDTVSILFIFLFCAAVILLAHKVAQ